MHVEVVGGCRQIECIRSRDRPQREIAHFNVCRGHIEDLIARDVGRQDGFLPGDVPKATRQAKHAHPSDVRSHGGRLDRMRARQEQNDVPGICGDEIPRPVWRSERPFRGEPIMPVTCAIGARLQGIGVCRGNPVNVP